MKKYYTFILVAMIAFLLNIFLLFNVETFNNFKFQLLFLELMVLISIAVAIKLYYKSKASNLFAIIFFVLMTIDSLFYFSLYKTIMPTAFLLISLYGLTYYIKQRKPKKRKRVLPHRKEDEIKKLIPDHSDVAPKIIIEKKNFVASKNGKVFFEHGSKRVKNIKRKNRVYFNTKVQARKAGFKEFKG